MSRERMRVAVYGATGHTGAFVVDELLRRGLEPIAVGRDADRLRRAMAGRAEPVVQRVAAVEDGDALGGAFADADAVINCAGPFLDTAPAVAGAAIGAGAHYLDVTAEQESARRTFDRFADPAATAGVAVVPGVGFYGGLGDLLVTTAAAGMGRIGSATIAISLSSWHPTAGTRATGLRNRHRRVTIRGGELVPIDGIDAPGRWVFPEPVGAQEVSRVGFTEVPLLRRHHDIVDLDVLLVGSALVDVADPGTPPPVALDRQGRSAQTFLVDARVRGAGGTRRLVASGRDIYAFTAPLVVEVSEQLRRSGAAGAVTPGQIAAGDTLGHLARDVPDFSVSPLDPSAAVS